MKPNCRDSYQPALTFIKSNATNVRKWVFNVFILPWVNDLNRLSSSAICPYKHKEQGSSLIPQEEREKIEKSNERFEVEWLD